MDSIKKVLELSGYQNLNPSQKAAIDAGLLDEGNFVVAAPTASGKTLLAEIAALEAIKKGKKVVYIVPLKALANEKYDEFSEKYESLGIRVALSIGDMDNADPKLIDYDIIIVTSEKLDSLLRHGAEWINFLGLVVVDEIHLLDSANRGPTLEVVLTRLRQVCNPKIIGLSATINNYQDLANWLDAKSVKSDYRPVQLFKGIYIENRVRFSPDGEIEFNPSFSEITNIVNDTMQKQKQGLVFVSTRKSSESVAEEIGSLLMMRLNDPELSEIAKKIENVLEKPTEQCKKLAKCVRMGSAFHHAGLTAKQRKLVEDGFKKNSIKFISATPTLAAGINLPAYRVIIRDLKRFYSFKGMDYLPSLEIEQMSGRAGRPKYDSKGEAILIPKNKGEAEYAWNNYINGETENIYSKLGVEPVLRVHVLSLIASGVVTSKTDIDNFFKKTFYAHQFKDFDELKIKLERMTNLLERFKFISVEGSSSDPFQKAGNLQGNQSVKSTTIGKRVSELYIDPITADYLIKNFGSIKTSKDFALIHLLCNCMEIKPLVSARKKDLGFLNDVLEKEEVIQKMPNEWDVEYDDYMSSIKTAAVFYSWMNEKGEDWIFETLNVSPGELKARLDTMDWLLYSSGELALLLGEMEMLKIFKKMRVKLKYGIKEELMPLIKLKGIGRVKARQLFSAGLKDVGDLKKAPFVSLSRLVGEKTAEKIRNQL